MSTGCGFLTIHSDYKSMGLYPGGLKTGIDFASESEWAYIRVGLYPGGSLFQILR